MGHREKHRSSSPLPLLSRLDRLDHLMEHLEENHCLSWRQHGSSSSDHEQRDHMEDNCHTKTLSSALEEVHDKGSLMDRLAMLENRVLQLSLAMDAAKTTSRSNSSSPTDYLALDEKQDGSLPTTNPLDWRKKREKRSVSTIKCRKWFQWFHVRC